MMSRSTVSKHQDHKGLSHRGGRRSVLLRVISAAASEHSQSETGVYMSLALEVVVLLWLSAQNTAKPTQKPSSFIGSDGCKVELLATDVGFSIDLDRKEGTRLETHELNGKPTLLLIQYANDDDRCGVVRDIAVAPDSKDVFQLDCIDQTNPGRVVVGVHQGNPGALRWKASKAWYVDFRELKLIPTNDSATCLNCNYAGSDDGSDLRSRAAAGAKKKCP